MSCNGETSAEFAVRTILFFLQIGNHWQFSVKSFSIFKIIEFET